MSEANNHKRKYHSKDDFGTWKQFASFSVVFFVFLLIIVLYVVVATFL